MSENPSAVETFIARWSAAGGSERANYQLFISELCELLEVPKPDPARDDTRDNVYVFERRVTFSHGDGSQSSGFIDCYRRGTFVLEAKKIRSGGTQTFDDALMRARAQAEGYARALPADEGRPPFLVVVDVGNVIELYAEFSRSGATYTPYPDPRSHRLTLESLRDDVIRQRLRTLWLAPDDLDPSRKYAQVTRQIAEKLAAVAKSLEGSHPAQTVAGFLTRCLFSMFAEDVQLIPKGSFTELIKSLRDAPEQLVPLLGELWRAMDKGEFSVAIRATLPRFNGKLFKQPEVIPLCREQIDLLCDAAQADWTQVEPAIFGTLLERALDPEERHALGAHYTPRAYVERLVLPTVMEPLRQSWAYVQAAALLLAQEGKHNDAIAELRAFHHRLCKLRVLDPACGSGNFLYVTLEHMKRLEGEVLNRLHEFGHGQALLETEGLTVDPHQFLGLEINPRAAAIAELVLWIGYLQWHFRTQGAGLPPSPILKDFRNVECRDAVLAYDSVEFVTDVRGVPVTRWDGRTMKKHPVTGEDVPDEAAQVPLERYVNPRQAEWPEADVVVGNPPFIGKLKIRTALGDGYVEALRGAWQDVPDSADFVMFWWHHAAQLVAQGKLSRFGFITTNSITMTYNRRVVQGALDDGVHLDFAIPDHPWVDSADGAAVRIAMTVVAPGAGEGRRQDVVAESEGKGEGLDVELAERSGLLHADLAIGANVASAEALMANGSLSTTGVIPHGAGMVVTREDAVRLEADAPIKPYRNGRDLTDKPRDFLVIDCYGLTAEDVRRRFPSLYQWLLDRVKPERDANRDKDLREKWWLHRRNNEDMRRSLHGLSRYIATTMTAKHRVFQFLNGSILPDQMLVVVALNDDYSLGVLSSRVHIAWALATGSRLGVGNDPRYNKSRCFETFPFPAATPAQQARIGALAEELDAHRKRVLAQHESLTLTGLYNVLEKLRAGTPLNPREKTIHDQGLVAVLKSLHDDLDSAVLEAYGWADLLPCPDEQALLSRLVDLNAQRAAEEKAGQIRWLRPDFQSPAVTAPPSTQASDVATPVDAATAKVKATQSKSATSGLTGLSQMAWPDTLPAQMAAVDQILASTPAPLNEAAIAAHFKGKGKWKTRLPQILATLLALGKARQIEGQGWRGQM